MKRGNHFLLCLILLTSLLLPASLMADEQTENLVSIIIESFDPGSTSTQWVVQGSKFSTKGYPKMAIVEGWPEGLHGSNWDNEELEVMGINTQFDRQGYNYIEIIPVKKGDDGNLVPNPLPLKGRVKTIDTWVLGTKYNYYMEVHVRDFRGVVHVLNLGSLQYEGWKNLKANIPSYIPQSSTYAPYFEGLSLVKFMIWTTPTEKVGDYIVFIDQIKILTDDFVSRFDGDALLRTEVLNEINWTTGTTGE